jgi:hypothetical protein
LAACVYIHETGLPWWSPKKIKHVKVRANNFGQYQHIMLGKIFWRVFRSLVDLLHEFVIVFDKALFSWLKNLDFDTVALLFVFGNYCSTMD